MGFWHSLVKIKLWLESTSCYDYTGSNMNKYEHKYDYFKAFKAFHVLRIIHSVCTHPYADVMMGEDLQFTKQSWSFRRKQGSSLIQYNGSEW